MIGAFVGSFNPVTMGHLMIAQGILNELNVSKVVFVPVSDHYQKDTLTVQAQQRYQMLQLALENQSNLLVDDMEIVIDEQSGHQNKTLETLRLLKEKYQQDVALIIGADNLKELYWWWHADEMCNEFELLLISRDGIDIEQTIHQDEWLSQHVKKYQIVNSGVCAVSSHMIRNWVAEGKNIHYFVDSKVEKYIVEHQLYKMKEE